MNPRERPNMDPVELAIGRVLESESAARQSIADAHTSAQARLAAARAQALAIAERAEGRLARTRRSIEARIAAREEQVDANIRALRADAARPSTDSARIGEAVAAVAASITGAGPR
jgi:vacuolar-type H+-ATPase subunit H